MAMAQKSFPEQVIADIRELFHKPEEAASTGQPGSELPAFGKCGCHPGGIHPSVDVEEVEQRNDEPLVAIPVKVENLINVRTLPAKRGSMETFYPGTTPAAAVLIQGRDPRIKRLILAVFSQGVWIGTQSQIASMIAGGGGATNSQGFLIQPNNVIPPWEGIDQDLWAMAQNGGAVLSVRREYWSDI